MFSGRPCIALAVNCSRQTPRKRLWFRSYAACRTEPTVADLCLRIGALVRCYVICIAALAVNGRQAAEREQIILSHSSRFASGDGLKAELYIE